MSGLPPLWNRMPQFGYRGNAKPRATANPMARYEELKSIWSIQHRDATASEYETAMRAIAAKCGV